MKREVRQAVAANCDAAKIVQPLRWHSRHSPDDAQLNDRQDHSHVRVFLWRAYLVGG